MKQLCAFALLFAAGISWALASDTLVRIEGGTFIMGSPPGEPRRLSNELQREVAVSSFYMGIHEVTQAEYEEVMGTNPSLFKGPDLPVEQVSWFDAVIFANRLSEQQGFQAAYTIHGHNVTWDRSANGFRLPTEAEWEFAARAGTTTVFHTGNNITTREANYDGSRPYNNNADGIFRQRTMPAGSFEPNAFGLYDMHGNVGEWCWDWNVAYSREARTDPAGPPSGFHRVFRGGGWNHAGDFLHSARRGGNVPTTRGSYIGFRLARNAQ